MVWTSHAEKLNWTLHQTFKESANISTPKHNNKKAFLALVTVMLLIGVASHSNYVRLSDIVQYQLQALEVRGMTMNLEW